MTSINSRQKGFTIIELMIATVTFSLILLILTASVVQIGKMYYKGLIASRTQGASRSIMDTVSRSIQFSQNSISTQFVSGSAGVPDTGVVCVGNQRFTYALNAQVSNNPGVYGSGNHTYRHALWQDVSGTCAPADLTQETPPGGTNGKELLEENARLTKLEVSPSASSPNLWVVTIGVLFGDDDLVRFDGSGNTLPSGCRSDVGGSQWCAYSELSTQVNKRVQ